MGQKGESKSDEKCSLARSSMKMNGRSVGYCRQHEEGGMLVYFRA